MTKYIPKSVPSLTVQAPPSKSFSHRMLIAAALSARSSRVSNIAFSDDILATLDCLEALGYAYERLDDSVCFLGYRPVRPESPVTLKCRESASTMRFILPVALVRGGKFIIEGSPRLLERGLDGFLPVFGGSGINFVRDGKAYSVEGRLVSGEYAIDCSRSSQYLSALLMALPLCEGESRIRTEGKFGSASYVAITKSVLLDAGIVVFDDSCGVSVIPGNQEYSVRNWCVEGDWTHAAYLEAFKFIDGASVRVTGLNGASVQGDRRFPELFETLRRDSGPINLDDNIDLGPVLFAAASLCGHGLFTGTSRLRYKESDRVKDMLGELSKFGVRYRVEGDEVEIFSDCLRAPDSVLSSHADHRIAMALSLLAARFGAEIDGAEAVNKSFPSFYGLLGL